MERNNYGSEGVYLEGLPYYNYHFNGQIMYHSPAMMAEVIRARFNLQNPSVSEESEIYYDKAGRLKKLGLTLLYIRGRYYLQGESENKEFSSLDELSAYVIDRYKLHILPLEIVTEKRFITQEYVWGKDGEQSGILFKITFDRSASGEEKVSYIAYFGGKDAEQHRQIVKDMVYNRKSQSDVFPTPVFDYNTENEVGGLGIYSSKLFHKYTGQLNVKGDLLKAYLDIYGSLDVPFLFTIGGTPNEYSHSASVVHDFLLKAGLKSAYIEDPVASVFKELTSRKEKEEMLRDRVGFTEALCDKTKAIIEEKLDRVDAVICDRGFYECFVWFHMFYKAGMVSEQEYRQFLLKMPLKKECRPIFYAQIKDASSSFLLDIKNNLSLRPRLSIDPAVLSLYNKAFLDMESVFKENGVAVRESFMPYDIADDILDEFLTLQRKKNVGK